MFTWNTDFQDFQSPSICRIKPPRPAPSILHIWFGLGPGAEIRYHQPSSHHPPLPLSSSVISPINISSTPGRCFLYGGSSLSGCQWDQVRSPLQKEAGTSPGKSRPENFLSDDHISYRVLAFPSNLNLDSPIWLPKTFLALPPLGNIHSEIKSILMLRVISESAVFKSSIYL